MLTNDKFQTFLKMYGVSKEEHPYFYTLALNAWLSAENACLNHSVQVPRLLVEKHESDNALLKKAMQKPTKQPVDKKSLDLTTEEIQFVVDFFNAVLSQVQVSKEYMKLAAKELWERCDPEDERTEAYYNALNSIRSVQKKQDEKLAKLSEIQRKLKKMR